MKINLIILSLIIGTSLTHAQVRFNDLRLNEIQVIGSHNSYKKAIQKELLQEIYNRDSILALSLQYEHPSLIDQLNLGLRNLEIDLFYDPNGGLYFDPLGQTLLLEKGIEPELFNEKDKLNKPGLKVFHIQDIDFRSHNVLFTDCLKEIKNWSKENIDHLPIIITINTKDKKIDLDSSAIPIKFDRRAMDSIDEEILSIFDINQLITPDFIQGSYATLEQSVLENGWPKIKEVKGKVLFILDEKGKKRNKYLNINNSLKNKVMFVNQKEGKPNSAIMIVNNPIKNFDKIRNLVSKGYIVRTRADAGTKEARINDFSRFHMAMKSGAQVITTDYYVKSTLFESNYKVIFENNKYEQQNNVIKK